MYRCSNCGATMSQPLDRCPNCRVLLSGVKCEACGYIGGKTEFISNNHRCPKCNSIAYIPGVSRTTSSLPSTLNKRFIMGILTIIVHIVFTMFPYQQEKLFALDFVNTAVVGLVIYEILYRTRKQLSLKTLIIYIILAIPVSRWLYAFLYGVESGYYSYVFSLLPLTDLFSATNYLFNLYYSIEITIFTCIAFWLIRTSSK